MEPTAARLPESWGTDLNAPTFDADWQRRAFGVAVALSEFGHYSWDAFQRQLIAAIGDWEAGAARVSGEAGAAGTSDQAGWEYYDHWLAALERVLVENGLITEAELRSHLDAPAPPGRSVGR